MNRAMPLIRYDIGDVGVVVTEPCSCGRGTMRFKVLGRVQDTLVTPSGRVISDHEVSDFLYGYPGLDWFQLVQRPEQRFDLQVVDNGRSELSINALSQDLGTFLGGGARVKARLVRSIPPEAGGKYRFIKSISHNQL